MEQIIYGITLVVYAIFIIRFFLSWIGGDFDLDADLDVSDVVSFKGLTHFLMGSSGWLSIKNVMTHSIEWYDWLIAFFIGIIFVGILFYLYKFMMKLECSPKVLTGEELVGVTGTIYSFEYYDMNTKIYHYIVTVYNNIGTIEVSGISTKEFKTGDKVILSHYKGTYYTLI